MYYSSDPTLISLLGAVDNFGEAKPSWNERPTILGVIITFMILSIFCILFRLYIRLFIVKSPGWDDVFVCLFMITGSFGSIMICSLTDYGFGQHFLKLTEKVMSSYLMRFYIANATYAMSTTFIKLSLLFQYLNIFHKGTRRRQVTIGVFVLIGVWGIVFSFMAWFPCFPVSGYWNFLTEDATCYGFGSEYAANFVSIYECHAGMNMVFDVIVLALPMSIYFEKDTTRQVRLGLIGLFIMGTIVNIFSIWRLATMVVHRATTYPTFDPTWYGPINLIQACLEVDAASICASIPIFWPVLSTKFNEIFITREIIITQEHRRLSDLGEGAGFELWRSRSSSSGQQGSIYPAGESEIRLDSVNTQGKSLNYIDRYVLDQVDPLRADKKVGVESTVTVGPLSVSQERPSRVLYLDRS